VILTPVRDVNYYKLYLKEEGLDENSDTTFLHVYVTHLKSSSGSDNQQLRLQSVESFLPHLNAHSVNDLVIFAGDFNVYNSSEPAYQALLSSDNSPQLNDPINSPGNWGASNYPLKEILTQSTRTSQVYGDGAGGGIDDRFDFILCSDALLNSSSNLYYVEDTYKSYGNSGECYNSSVFSCSSTNGLPEAVTSAIYYTSDHFPVVMELETPLALSAPELTIRPSHFKAQYRGNGRVEIDSKQALQGLIIFNSTGQQVAELGETIATGKSYHRFDLSPGLYLIADGQGLFKAQRILVND
jgi:hypothetical protein